ncbi:MAG: bifunctional riboflavin kinase/FAD synthetase [Bacteroidales bacterium]|nr:bifunctional riboflavin kinase/FAD synthetase [Bacteroidales bacterium]
MVVAATGFFDGVHLGHRKVIEQLCKIAWKEGKESAVITFWPHPRNILQQDADRLRLLTSLEEKKALIKSFGVDNFFVIPFDKSFSMLSTEEFLKQYLIDMYHVSTLIVGYDHRLGHKTGRNTQDSIFSVAQRVGIKPIRVSEYVSDDFVVSSTVIRDMITVGKITDANKMLGYRYGLQGVVVSGEKIGRTFGFPTANIQLYEPLKLIPGKGVYIVWVGVMGKTYLGICNIGNRPTIGDNRGIIVETHILDFDEDIYGLDIKIEFVDRIRSEVKFQTRDELRDQLIMDKKYAAHTFLLSDKIVLR